MKTKAEMGKGRNTFRAFTPLPQHTAQLPLQVMNLGTVNLRRHATCILSEAFFGNILATNSGTSTATGCRRRSRPAHHRRTTRILSHANQHS